MNNYWFDSLFHNNLNISNIAFTYYDRAMYVLKVFVVDAVFTRTFYMQDIWYKTLWSSHNHYKVDWANRKYNFLWLIICTYILNINIMTIANKIDNAVIRINFHKQLCIGPLNTKEKLPSAHLWIDSNQYHITNCYTFLLWL